MKKTWEKTWTEEKHGRRKNMDEEKNMEKHEGKTWRKNMEEKHGRSRSSVIT